MFPSMSAPPFTVKTWCIINGNCVTLFCTEWVEYDYQMSSRINIIKVFSFDSSFKAKLCKARLTRYNYSTCSHTERYLTHVPKFSFNFLLLNVKYLLKGLKPW